MKKTVIAIISAIILLSALGLSVFADFGSGVEVMANNTEIIKTGIFGRKLTLSDLDFKQGLAINDFDSITVTKLPSSNEGALMLAGRRVAEGAKIRRKNINALVFVPTSKDVSEAKFTFTLSPDSEEREIVFRIRFTDKINYEPKIDESSQTSLMTQRDISIYGKMAASDGEGDKIEYIVVSYPEKGFLEILDKESGEFRYTPAANYIGEDSFVYVARDEWGNFSVPSEMNVTVSERRSEVEYEDMKGEREYNAAVALTAAGIMDGKVMGDGKYFMPDEEVSRAEFVVMLMKAMGIRADAGTYESYFDDNEEIPKALRSYIATAQKQGIVSGKFKDGKLLFSPNEKITLYDAAVMMNKLIKTDIDVNIPVFKAENDIPIYAKDDCYFLSTIGIIEVDFDEMSASDTLTRRMCADYLYKLMNM